MHPFDHIALGWQRQVDLSKTKASQDYTVRACLKIKQIMNVTNKEDILKVKGKVETKAHDSLSSLST